MARILGIIIGYQHPEVAMQAVLSLASQSVKIDIVFWNNGGIDESLIPPRVTFVDSPENLYWTPALNAAIENYLHEDHDYIFYMNHDVRLPTNAVEQLVEFLDATPDAGAAGPVGSHMGGLQDRTTHTKVLKTYHEDSPPVRAQYLMGTVQIMKREAWEKVGPFDNRMPLGADDFDYSIRMKEAGYSLWVLPRVSVEHVGHITGDSQAWKELGQQGWDWFDEKYDGYYRDKTEANESLWNSIYNSNYPIGTGISEEEKIRRGIKTA